MEGLASPLADLDDLAGLEDLASDEIDGLGRFGRRRRRRRHAVIGRAAPRPVPPPAPAPPPDAVPPTQEESIMVIDGLGRIIRAQRRAPKAQPRRKPVRSTAAPPAAPRPAPATPTQNHPDPQRIAEPTSPLQVLPQELRTASPQAIAEASKLVAAHYPKWFDGRVNQSYFRNYMHSYLHPQLADLGNATANKTVPILLIGGALVLAAWLCMRKKKS